MEVEAHTDLSDYDGDIGTCIACLYEEELDNAGLCSGCNPVSQETRDALVALLKPTTKEAQPQETK